MPNSQIVAAFTGIVGADSVELGVESSDRCLVPGCNISCAVYPKTQQELAAAIALAHQNKWQILPYGNASKLDWGGLVGGASAHLIAISTKRINRLIEHAVGDMTVTVEAGIKFSELQAILAEKGQFLAIDPAYAERSTLGGIVATASSGSLRQRYGGVRDLLLGISFVRSDGELVKAGGRVVKNVAGYDLMKLLTGSFGTLGVISQLTFRLYPLPESSQTVLLTGAPDRIAAAHQKLMASTLRPAIADLLSSQVLASLELGSGSPVGLAVGLAVRFDGIQASVEQQSQQLVELGLALNLQGSIMAESNFWQKLPTLFWRDSKTSTTVVCKVGILPSKAIEVLCAWAQFNPSLLHYAQIHAASGLGVLRLENLEVSDCLQKFRTLCEATGGFLTILEAPVSLKQQMDVWGYKGNALAVMQGLKQQFDCDRILSPNRFVVG
jgi:glycolate oxidase FAD binding subunit